MFAAACIIFVAGCATTKDLKRVQGDLNGKIDETNESIRLLKEEDAGIHDDLKKTGEAISSIRTRQAEIIGDITGMRDSIQQLAGAVEDLRKDLSAAQASSSRSDGEFKHLKEKLEGVSFKTNFLENFLGIGKKEEQPKEPNRNVQERLPVKGSDLQMPCK